jgi:Response regulators consisting of a CheY-like receiver domain and a winged-helix DNA-binding domain
MFENELDCDKIKHNKWQINGGMKMAQGRVLIVEDEIAIAKMIAMNLKVAGYDVTICYDGSEAAESIRERHDYDIALLDVMLPGMDGFALLDVVSPYSIPVIFLTARDDINSKVQGLQGGAEDYIVKPFEMLELMVRMEKVLERTKKPDDVIHILDMEINLLEHTVRKNGEEIPLKPMEFELLCVLVQNKNIAISREELLRRVWGMDYLGETRTVDVHIGQLRKKLSLSDQIKTISKLGYRLEEM